MGGFFALVSRYEEKMGYKHINIDSQILACYNSAKFRCSLPS